MEVLYISLIIFILVLFILFRTKTKRKKITTSTAKQELLIKTNILLKELEKDYEAEKVSEEEYLRMKEELETLIEDSIEKQVSELDLGNKFHQANSKVQELNDKSDRLLLQKEVLTTKISDEVGRFKTFLDSNVIYPKEFVFTANTLQGKIVDMNDVKPDKLPKIIAETEKMLFKFHNKLNYFLSLHTKVKQMVVDNPELSGNEKQEIYFHIQQGELKKAEELLETVLGSKNEQPEKELEK